jgi:hypothetical protein
MYHNRESHGHQIQDQRRKVVKLNPLTSGMEDVGDGECRGNWTEAIAIVHGADEGNLLRRSWLLERHNLQTSKEIYEGIWSVSPLTDLNKKVGILKLDFEDSLYRQSQVNATARPAAYCRIPNDHSKQHKTPPTAVSHREFTPYTLRRE